MNYPHTMLVNNIRRHQLTALVMRYVSRTTQLALNELVKPLLTLCQPPFLVSVGMPPHALRAILNLAARETLDDKWFVPLLVFSA